jgi:hypothetical protein
MIRIRAVDTFFFMTIQFKNEGNTQEIKSLNKSLFNKYDSLFALFAHKKWEEGCFGFGQSPKHFSPHSRTSEQKRLLLWRLFDFAT